jgi:hypothetical protein
MRRGLMQDTGAKDNLGFVESGRSKFLCFRFCVLTAQVCDSFTLRRHQNTHRHLNKSVPFVDSIPRLFPPRPHDAVCASSH